MSVARAGGVWRPAPTHVPLEWQPIHERHFAAMNPAEFLRWWRLGRTETIHGRPVTREGVIPSSLYFVLSGAAKVQRGGTVVTRLAPEPSSAR